MLKRSVWFLFPLSFLSFFEFCEWLIISCSLDRALTRVEVGLCNIYPHILCATKIGVLFLMSVTSIPIQIRDLLGIYGPRQY
ncbi:hypothetical protein CLU79DRAFT_730479 [Phycomyces nitens]|nr:hypothetical protein CLU79DRAFT_730479 [Phycomyces nitens]